jgi:ATP-dependent Clp protease ATP-binding subunit ClpC
MTSNIGADLWKKQGALGFKPKDEDITYKNIKVQLMDEIKKSFKPEFLNRVDDIIIFHPLLKSHLQEILEIETARVVKRLSEHDIDIELMPEAKRFLIEKGFDAVYGARPLKRIIQTYLEDPLAEEIIKGGFKGAKKIKVGFSRDHLVFDMA